MPRPRNIVQLALLAACTCRRGVLDDAEFDIAHSTTDSCPGAGTSASTSTGGC